MAAESKLNKLHNKAIFNPVCSEHMTESEKAEALKSLLFLKKQRDGMVGGRSCTDGCSHKS